MTSAKAEGPCGEAGYCPGRGAEHASGKGAQRDGSRRVFRILLGLTLLLVAVFLLSEVVLAQSPEADPEKPAGLSKPIVAMVALAALSLAPFILVMTTSFLKFSVVGSILRSALGTQQIPPNQVLMGLSLILTIYVMSPIGRQIYTETQELFERSAETGVLSDKGIEILKVAIQRGKKPYLDFLVRHSNAKERQLFMMLSQKLHRGDDTYVPDEREFTGLVAAFVTSELTEAFQIGFVLFVPFIVVDMIVANVLLAMGMQMLSPTIVSLPIKLLLFVLVDGWHLLMRGLVLGYA
ncbi:type III secretion system export apparatus subunit SctR [Planctomycetota bacterium]